MKSKNQFNEHYLNVPLMFNYGYEITPNARIFVFAGPSASFGLYADHVTRIEASLDGNSGSTEKETAELWGDDSTYKRCDLKLHHHSLKAGIAYMF